MITLVIDASVWVSAVDSKDSRSEPSRRFLSMVVDGKIPIALPEYAELEIACALARRLRNPTRGSKLAGRMLGSPLVAKHSVNRPAILRAIRVGTRSFLRSGDSLYAALARSVDGQLVSWDRELIARAGAITPDSWVKRHA